MPEIGKKIKNHPCYIHKQNVLMLLTFLGMCAIMEVVCMGEL